MSAPAPSVLLSKRPPGHPLCRALSVLLPSSLLRLLTLKSSLLRVLPEDPWSLLWGSTYLLCWD